MPICHLNMAKIPYTMHFNELQLGWPSLHYKQTYIIYIYINMIIIIYTLAFFDSYFYMLWPKDVYCISSEGLFIYDIS